MTFVEGYVIGASLADSPSINLFNSHNDPIS